LEPRPSTGRSKPKGSRARSHATNAPTVQSSQDNQGASYPQLNAHFVISLAPASTLDGRPNRIKPSTTEMSSFQSNDSALPEFVEPDYNLDAATPTLKEAEPDPCCTRCGSECMYPGWFSIQEGQRTIDIPASFGPTSLTARLIKFVLMVWFIASLAYKWSLPRYQEYPAFFLSYLTHWGLILSSLWLVVSFINSLVPPSQPTRPSDPISLWTKFSWLLFTVAAHFTLIVVAMYWILDYRGQTLDYTNLFSHIFVILIWPEGLILNRIPIRWKHLPLPMFMGAALCIWLVIHQMVTGIGVPVQNDNDPDTNDDLLYPAVDFKEKTVSSSILCTMAVFVIIPLLHLLLWSLSLYSFPCNCSGYNRRYVQEMGSGSSGDVPGGSNNVNVNVHEP